MVEIKKPDWIRVKGVDWSVLEKMKALTERYKLHTVCEGATCPNMGECFACGTATFMLLGEICTRNCAFCSVKSGQPLPPDPDEPRNVALASRDLGLKHVVLTCVTRDDLADGGAGQFVLTLREIKSLLPDATTDVLVSDLRGSRENVAMVLEEKPSIFAHNLETVPHLYSTCRSQADYKKSLRVLEYAKQIDPAQLIKCGLMVGLGEKPEQVLEVLRDLRAINCDFLTIGQYLRPTKDNLSVKEFVTPEQFDRYRDSALEMGFTYVASAPFVRSSFHSEDALKHIK